ncbi:hypothetical protein TREES_T100006460 [Tupaia chinensis]|uniref:Uncharacterized protein n=1 Tax=Tupaia chinensis TaxID=246437 RepID=L9KZY0_TUPCH|nr:hypothetical protein TREES_T100006460 [Tupaia chinensis]
MGVARTSYGAQISSALATPSLNSPLHGTGEFELEGYAVGRGEGEELRVRPFCCLPFAPEHEKKPTYSTADSGVRTAAEGRG